MLNARKSLSYTRKLSLINTHSWNTHSLFFHFQTSFIRYSYKSLSHGTLISFHSSKVPTHHTHTKKLNKQRVIYDVVWRWRFRAPTWRRCTRSLPIPWAPITAYVAPLRKPSLNPSLDLASAHASWYFLLSLRVPMNFALYAFCFFFCFWAFAFGEWNCRNWLLLRI